MNNHYCILVEQSTVSHSIGGLVILKILALPGKMSKTNIMAYSATMSAVWPYDKKKIAQCLEKVAKNA
jgi:hypothetical protein